MDVRLQVKKLSKKKLDMDNISCSVHDLGIMSPSLQLSAPECVTIGGCCPQLNITIHVWLLVTPT